MKKYIVSLLSLLRFPAHLLFLTGVYSRYFLGIKTKPLNADWNAFSLEKSFIRWGDGETMVALGMPMVFTYKYENSSPKLSDKMKRILSYPGNNIVVGLPKEYLVDTEDNTPDIRAWIITRAFFQSGYNLRKEYDDAFFYRNLETYENFLKLYQGKRIFLITNEESIQKVVNDGRLGVIGSYAIPSQYAFSSYDTFKPAVVSALESVSKEELMVMISGGPAGKILSFELTTEYGYVCHDVGQFFDLYLKK